MIGAIISGLFFSIWRRAFGGMFEGNFLGIRAVQCTLFILGTLSLFLLNETITIYLFAVSAVMTGWLYGMEFAQAHFPIFEADEGKDNPDETLLQRYAGKWYTWACKKIFTEDNWYNRAFDWTWVGLRYTCPMIVLSVIYYFTLGSWEGLWFILIGFSVMPIYWICDELNLKDIGLFGQYDSRLAEWIVGFVYGFGSYLILC